MKPKTGTIEYLFDYEKTPYEKLSVQFQDLKFPISLTPKDLIEFAIKLSNSENKRAEIEEGIKAFEIDKIMNTNVKGTFFMCQKVVEHMKKNGIKGHILNISSSSALRPAWGPYQMSKWAIAGFTKGLAEKCQPYGIVVNALAPGQTATPMLGISNDDIYNGYAMAGRYIMPQEIANLAVFMISDMGNMIVGDTFYMTGGSGVVTFNG